MQKINRHIEIVSSANVELSSMSALSRNAIRAVLAKYYQFVDITLINDLADLEALLARKPDLVFLGMKFIPENPALGINDHNKIWISQQLDKHGIAYTGSDHNAHKLELDKQLAKQRVLDAGLLTSPYKVIRHNQSQSTKDITLTYPLFVKPNNRGGGVGISSTSLVSNVAQLSSKVQSITTELQSDSLIEEYLPGREFSVAILKTKPLAALSVMPIELIAEQDYQGARILSEEVKSSNAEHAIKLTDKKLRAAVCELAINVFYALGARDYGRIDIRLDAAGTPHFLEANLLPSLISGYGSFPKACKLNAKLDYEVIILTIVNMALARSSKDVEVHDQTLKSYSYNEALGIAA